MALLYGKVVHTVSRPPQERTDIMIDQILPWFRKKSELFKLMKTEILKEIIKNCEFTTCVKDTVLIRQGDRGDCFYIILRGSVSVHIQTNFENIPGGEEPKSAEEEEVDQEEVEQNTKKKTKELDRSVYGNFVGKLDAGRSFGELALINADCIRNASIIVDEMLDLLVVNRELYNGTLKAFQTREYEEKKRFVEEYPLFSGWQPRYKKQLAMSLRKQKLNFDGILVKQGCPADGLCFLLSGQAKMLVDPVQHEVQYPEFYPLPEIEELEKVEARENVRREMNMAVLKVEEKKPAYPRPKSPYLDRKRPHRSMEVCVIGAIEIIGDLEITFKLSSNAETVQCTQEAEVFILDQRNFERLVEKRNPASIEMIKATTHEKLELRMSWLQQKELPLLRYFLYKLDEKKRHEEDKHKYKRQEVKDTIAKLKIDSVKRGLTMDARGSGSVLNAIRMRDSTKRGQTRGSPTGLGVTRNFINSKKNLVPSMGSRAGTFFAARPSIVVDGNINDEGEGGRTEVDAEKKVSNGEGYNGIDFNVDHVAGFGLDSRILCENKNCNSSTPSKSDASNHTESQGHLQKEISDSALTQLEDRIAAWHGKFGDTNDSSKHLVKLHRYNAEEVKKPFPGRTVVIKPKFRSKRDVGETIDFGGSDASSPRIANLQPDHHSSVMYGKHQTLRKASNEYGDRCHLGVPSSYLSVSPTDDGPNQLNNIRPRTMTF
ncbi:hypothetical protein CHS0354_031791 [Potamilus streckersoni]|uniref:Cyclic nucleotide-binding domain-containing protein n=1 Tax=Potamilus streckersoni TaxID=2493646 RepID=A0AAE0RXF2_9BIVA|nr:hypothetical protein CHS0354_031791 [Potamilus streckersoni]